MKKKLVVFSGAGISAESGLKTFRDSGGLWEEYKIEEVATPEAWHRNPELVLEFYNKRRTQAFSAQPNDAHKVVAELQDHFDVHVITQNIDNLHERAGSQNVLHLHGEITKVRSTKDPQLVYDIGDKEVALGDLCDKGSQLRPHIVWFGEDVPAMWEAQSITSNAYIVIIVGSSLNVYPAASLIYVAPKAVNIYVVDPGEPLIPSDLDVRWIKEKAGTGMRRILEELKSIK